MRMGWFLYLLLLLVYFQTNFLGGKDRQFNLPTTRVLDSSVAVVSRNPETPHYTLYRNCY